MQSRFSFLHWFAFLATTSALTSCATTQETVSKELADASATLEAFCGANNKCTFFRPPADRAGTREIIAFNENGEETIVARPDRCLNGVPEVSGRVVALNAEYEIKADNKLELNTGQIFQPKFNLEAAFKNEKIDKVFFKLIDPYFKNITVLDVKDAMRSLPEDSICWEALSQPENMILHWVFGAKGIEYTFASDKGQTLSLDATILGSFGLSPGLTREFDGTTSVKFEGDFLYGYRAWSVVQSAGYIENQAPEIVELDVEQVEQLRSSAIAASQ